MISNTSAILFRKINHGDTSYVLQFFTADFGLSSYILKGAKNPKSKKKYGFLQPLSIVDLEVYKKKEDTLGYVKNINRKHVFRSIDQNVIKSSIALFLNEVFLKTIKEEHKNEELYTFLENTILALDKISNPLNFHLITLVQLSKVLGFGPETENSNGCSFFNLESGTYTSTNTSYNVDLSESPYFTTVLGMNFDSLETLKISTEQRRLLLNQLINYFHLHSHGLKNLASLVVLKTIFSD